MAKENKKQGAAESKKKFISLFVIVWMVFIMMIFPTCVTAKERLSSDQYVDPKGFFEMFPPAEWRLQEYPDDPRGKVAFYGPDKVELRVLVKGVDYGFEDMVDEMRVLERNLGVNTNIERIELGGAPAIQRTFPLNGHKLYFVDLLIGNTTHNIMYSALPNKYEKHVKIAQASISTYEPGSIRVADEDLAKHAIAKPIRLSKIFYDQGDHQQALMFIEEGLGLEPDNPVLLKLKGEILALKDTASVNAKDGEVSTTSDSNEESGPVFFMVISLIGAAILKSQKSIAQGTAAPGIARLTTPIIGGALMLAGIGGSFEKGNAFLGVLTCLLVLLVFFCHLLIPLIIEKFRKFRHIP